VPEQRRGSAQRLIAEFLVIVVGVLVALGVDSWRESVSERQLGLEHLENLVSDLSADSVILATMGDGLVQKRQSLAVLRSVAAGDLEVSSDSIAVLLDPSAVYGWRIPAARSAAYEEIMSTAGLRLIEDRVLRGRVVAYYENYEHQLERLDRHRSSYPSATYRLLPSEQYIGASGLGAEQSGLADGLRSDEMRALLNHETNYTRILAEQHEVLSSQVDVLLSGLRATLR